MDDDMMKMTKNHFQTLSRYFLTSEHRETMAAFFSEHPGTSSTGRRNAWDAYYRIVPESFQKTLYAYLDDRHIETALKHIMRSLATGQ